MSIRASANATVPVSPQELLEFVLDLERYRQADTKIVRVSDREGPDASGAGSVKLWGRLRWGPAAPDRQLFQLERWRRITFTGAPRQLARLLFNFVGTFECESTPTGTSFTHAYVFTFTPAFRFVERFLDSWLQDNIDAEVARVVDIFDKSHPA